MTKPLSFVLLSEVGVRIKLEDGVVGMPGVERLDRAQGNRMFAAQKHREGPIRHCVDLRSYSHDRSLRWSTFERKIAKVYQCQILQIALEDWAIRLDTL
jgi:hypothetical protein